ncbi:hypothetical protein BJ138DRAFT_1009327 [Hygrophoropsis aurantiaca]|uniref:Uncharacterized protein n=1 Tax=Hygrophoropsis aurantiaca TaxID=72124 RepID=A0ACB8AAQ9_9AGAM|nr:hypothetical protein BJ138DRAFT_1009327 [Hygrophoropsis aurantiaca]
MDPGDRHLRNPGRNPPVQPRRLATPPVTEDQTRSLASSASQYPQPSLPSIRQLHPYLPPSGMSQSHLPPSESSGYTYPPPSAYSVPSASGSSDAHATQTMQPQPNLYARHEIPESEAEGDTEQQGPAKKKRRRQALSCNGEYKFRSLAWPLITQRPLSIRNMPSCATIIYFACYRHCDACHAVLQNVNDERSNVTGSALIMSPSV